MAYRVGYRFCVAACRDERGDLKYPVLYAQRYKSREPGALPIATLRDNEPVEVLAYLDGAVVVLVPRTNEVGWLG